MKKNSILFSFMALLAVSWLFYSCSLEESYEEISTSPDQQSSVQARTAQAQVQQSRTDKAYMELGKKRENPFALDIINRAKTNLYGSKSSNKSATHQYIKFLPETQEQISLLDDWETDMGVPLFDFPLEYEIDVEGETYIDPKVTDSIYTYQYAAVPNGTRLPNVPTELITNLYLDKSDPLLLAESFILTRNEEEINEYVFNGGLSPKEIDSYDNSVTSFLRIPVQPTYPCPSGFEWQLIFNPNPGPGEDRFVWECRPVTPPPPPPTNACGCPIPSNRRNPAGCVRVENDFGMEPVQIASIKVKDTWFTSDLTFTDENGCWRINESYSGNVWMWVRFKNANIKARDTRYWFSLRAVRDYVGRFGSPPYNNITVDYSSGVADNTSRARRYWAAAHSLNTVNNYRNAAAADGIPLPKTDLNWTNAAGDGGAAAPMLQWQVFNSWPSFLAAWQFPLLYALSLPHLPDIVNQYDDGETSARFTGTGFHELGHASHYSLVGEGYWFSYRNHIINNGGYGSFGNFNFGSNPGRVALGEAIGNFTGALYGGTVAGGEGAEWEDNFIPRGLMWDLGDVSPFDNVTDPNNAAITGPDNISGFTPAMIFNGLTPGVDDIREFRDRLRTLHLGDTPNGTVPYNTFVDLYDVFN